MTHDEMIAVIQAHKDGKAIQYREKDNAGEWKNCRHPLWSFDRFNYRVKPEPREFWANGYKISGIEIFGGLLETEEDAKRAALPNARTVKFREVLD